MAATSQFYVYLLGIRTHAIDGECARDSLRRAEESLTRVSSGGAEVHVSHGSIDYDRYVRRVYALEVTRKRCGKAIHESVTALKRFRSELLAADLGDDETSALWMSVVMGYGIVRIGRELDMPSRHVWPMLTRSREALAASLGMVEQGSGTEQAAG